jgi:hypothetical protein
LGNPKIGLINETGEELCLPEVADPLILGVNIFRIPLVNHLKGPAKGILLMRNNYVMHVISHQRVRQKLKAITCA